MAANDAATLQPVEVFGLFAEIAAIPRGSGDEGRIARYLLDFAAKHGLEAEGDSAGNVLIRKPGRGAGVGKPGLILQSHMDMVQIKADDADIDMASEGVRLVVDGNYLRADRTTLGADNGIGMAYALALLLADDLDHPPLEAVFTTEEETGMGGALGFDASRLRGEVFINVDSEEEGVFYSSCAGGMRMYLRLPVERTPFASLPAASAFASYAITVDGLRGGHSGIEIIKQRGNANRLLGRILHDLSLTHDLHLVDFTGGIVDNAIPVAATAVVALPSADVGALTARLAALQAIFRKELEAADGTPDADGRRNEVVVALRPAPAVPAVFSAASTASAIALANLVPDGVDAMDLHLAQPMVETSSNFALVHCEDDAFVVNVSLRSSLGSKKEALARRIELLARVLGASVERGSAYPAWQYNPESRARDVFLAAYRKLFGKEPEVVGVHAGLECGVFDEAFRAAGRRLDLVSLGPDLTGAHSPEERVDIASTGRVWELVREAVRMFAVE